MKILITGSTGLLGQALVSQLASRCDVVGLSRHEPPTRGAAPHLVCDLTDAGATERVVRQVDPDVVIHTQALSDVDRCELEPQHAEQLNIQTVDHLCYALKAREPLLIALSTDYVFDGSKGSPYDETDEPRPLSVYGKTKLAGERRALRYPNAIVVRPSSLFGPGRMNFCDTIVGRFRQSEPVEAFADQVTSPTYSEDLAEALHGLIETVGGRSLTDLPRIYHITNAGSCSRVEFAKGVAGLLKANDSLIRPIQMRDQGRPAPRPANSSLTSRALPQVIGRILRPWHEAVRAYLTSQGWLN